MFSMIDNKFALSESRINRFDLFAATKNFVDLGSGRESVTLPVELEYLIHEAHIRPWEFDYYHQMKRSPDEIVITCFSTYLPTLLSELRSKQEIAEIMFSEGNGQLIGLYDEGGYDDKRRKAYIDLSDNGKLFVVNGAGKHAEVELRASGVLYSPTWNLTARFDSAKGTLLWENGSVWARNDMLPAFIK